MKFFRKTKRTASALALGLFLVLYVLTAVPALHVLIHPDAGDPRHECAVTLFSHGRAHHSATTIEIVRTVPLVRREASPSTPILISTDVQLPTCRGPPPLPESV